MIFILFFFCSILQNDFFLLDAGGLFEGDLFGDVSAPGVSSGGVGAGGGGLRRELEEAAAGTPRRGAPASSHERRTDSDDDDDGMDHYGGMSPAHRYSTIHH